MQGLWQNLSSNKFTFRAFGVVDLWINQNGWELHSTPTLQAPSNLNLVSFNLQVTKFYLTFELSRALVWNLPCFPPE